MSTANTLFKKVIKFKTEGHLPENSWKYLDAAFKGSPEAVKKLMLKIPEEDCGMLAVALYNYGIPFVAFREALEPAWQLDIGGLIAAAGNRRTLHAMFKYAAYPLPKKIPNILKVWRGTSGVSKSEAVQGFSWTLKREVACFFAIEYTRSTGRPLVLMREVSKKDILMYTNNRNEQEVVIFRRGPVVVDGSQIDWEKEAMQYGKKISS